MTNHILSLEKLANKWGGKFETLSKPETTSTNTYLAIRENFEHRGFEFAPFALPKHILGINFSKKIIVFNLNTILWGNLIHEMGHVFASKFRPLHSNEWSFFGWEYIVAKYIKGSINVWYEHNYDYVIDDTADDLTIKSATPYQRLEIIHERIKFALENKLARKKNNKITPLAIR